MALTKATDIIAANPDVKAFFAANDDMGLGIVQAVENAGKTGEISVVSVDGNEDALQSVEDGGLYATVAQYPYAIGSARRAGLREGRQGETCLRRSTRPRPSSPRTRRTRRWPSSRAPFESFENPLRLRTRVRFPSQRRSEATGTDTMTTTTETNPSETSAPAHAAPTGLGRRLGQAVLARARRTDRLWSVLLDRLRDRRPGLPRHRQHRGHAPGGRDPDGPGDRSDLRRRHRRDRPLGGLRDDAVGHRPRRDRSAQAPRSAWPSWPRCGTGVAVGLLNGLLIAKGRDHRLHRHARDPLRCHWPVALIVSDGKPTR